MSVDYEKLRAAFDFLITNRMVRTKATIGNLRHQEADIADNLDDPRYIETKRALEKMLDAYGYTLRTYNHHEMNGIPVNAKCHVIFRSSGQDLAPWMDGALLVKVLKVGNDSTKTARRWAFFLWYMFLGVVYTRLNRSPHDVERYTEAWFSKNEFVDKVKENIEKCRQLPTETRSPDLSILLDGSGTYKTKTDRFIKFLKQIRYIDQVPQKDQYTQTLACAQEVAAQAYTGFSHLIDEDMIDSGFSPDHMDNIYEARIGRAAEGE